MRISGTPSCAIQLPSLYSTSECTMLSGCTSTPIRSGSRSKSQRASITSKPLFMSVAESIVIFAPISQFGCASACAGLAAASTSALRLPERSARRGEPDLAHRRAALAREALRDRDVLGVERKQLRTARARGVEHERPPGDEHFFVRERDVAAASAAPRRRARARRCPRARRSRDRPCAWRPRTDPLRPTRRAGPARRAPRARARASSARATETSSGLNCLHCWISRSTERPAASATTRSFSGKREITSSVCVPIEPVEPSSAIRFTTPARASAPLSVRSGARAAGRRRAPRRDRSW